MTLTDRLLRPALEAALAEARAGLSAEPPVPAPPRLRRLLGFTRATGPALNTVRRVVDEDPEFRERVRDATTPDVVGAAGWLWLDRPPEWKVEFARILEGAEADDADVQADRGLAHAERARERAEQQAARSAARAEAAEALAMSTAADLAGERSARRAAEERAEAAEAALTVAAEERATAVRAWKETERALGEARAEMRRPQTPDPEVSEPVPAADPLDRAALSRLLATATEAATLLGATLGEAVGVLADADPTGRSRPGGATRGRGARTDDAGRRARRGRTSRRVPSPLPPGRFDDDPAVVEHLVRLANVLLLLDGYNVTKTAWPDASPAEQRERLVALLDALNARTGAEAMVVFDGAAPTTVPGVRHGSGAVRVRFSPEGVEADDVVLELLSHVPAGRPAVVVSSDNRVREGARALGANVVGSAEFLASPALGRTANPSA